MRAIPSAPPSVAVTLRRHQLLTLAALFVVVAVAVGALVFGPARGARDDLGHVRRDLHGTRTDIHSTLQTNRAQLRTAIGALTATE